jgi:quercetin dioxygenase-like cupin family protein
MQTPVLQPRADAATSALLGGSISVRLRHEQTAGRFALIENVIPAGYDVLPLHVHPSFDEAFVVLDGALTFTVGDETLTATPGTLVYAPGTAPHTFRNHTRETARMLLWVSPAGHERYFDALVATVRAAPGGRPDPARLGALMREHGISVVESGQVGR